MFIHGREAYRRNSLLVLYNFYKNVLYITCQYYFGYWSASSGQPLYEPVIYQFYNITMTSLAIMHYALFDFEYEKHVFMHNPLHYKLGLESRCYGKSVFMKYVLYGMWHALVVYFICFHAIAIAEQHQTDGSDIGFWIYGHVVYGVCVIISNVVLVHRFNNYTGWAEALAAGMCLAFFFIYFVESLMEIFPQVYLIFVPTFNQPIIWAAILLAVIQASIGEFFISRWDYLVVHRKQSEFDELDTSD